MSDRYLLIVSRDPFTSAEVERFYELGIALHREGHAVTLFLVQNGVLPARPGARSGRLSRLAQEGVQVLADEFSLRERGIPSARLADGVTSAPLDFVIDALAHGAKALWH
jgi:sulfur relay (sulfurtransferase) complex TusBCD TusD component (DsrE family)